MGIFIINLNDTVALCDSTIIELTKVVNTCQPCIHEAETTCNDVKIVGIICGTIIFLSILLLCLLRKHLKMKETLCSLEIEENKTKLALDNEERRRNFIYEDEVRNRRFVHEDEDRKRKKETEVEDRTRKLTEESSSSQHVAFLRDRQLKALDKVIEKINNIEDTDYQIWKELAKTIAELTKSINSK